MLYLNLWNTALTKTGQLFIKILIDKKYKVIGIFVFSFKK